MVFLLEVMDTTLERTHGILFWYMIMAAILLFSQKWKSVVTPPRKKWLVKMMEITGMAKLTSLIREKILSVFINN